MTNALLADTTYIAFRVIVFLIILYLILRFINNRTLPRPSSKTEQGTKSPRDTMWLVWIFIVIILLLLFWLLL